MEGASKRSLLQILEGLNEDDESENSDGTERIDSVAGVDIPLLQLNLNDTSNEKTNKVVECAHLRKQPQT